MPYLSEVVKITEAITVAAGAAAASDVTGAALDMSGWDGVLVIVKTGPIVTDAATSIKMQQDTVSAFNDDPQDLLGTSQTIADSDDNKIFYIDVYRPRERYVRVIAARATQAATVTATYLQYRGRKLATTHGATVAGERHNSPAEGTA